MAVGLIYAFYCFRAPEPPSLMPSDEVNCAEQYKHAGSGLRTLGAHSLSPQIAPEPGGDPCGILGDPCGILGHPCGILGDPLGMDLGLPKRAGRPPPHMVQLDEVVAGPIFQMRCKVAFTLALMSCPVRCCCYCYCY